MKSERIEGEFPIMIDYRGTPGPCPSSIPWEMIEPYERQALINHDQTLKRLAERGGLSPSETLLVMTGRTWGKVEDVSALEKEGCAFLDKLVRESQVAILSRRNAELAKAAREKLAHDKSEHYGGRCQKCFDVDDALEKALKGGA